MRSSLVFSNWAVALGLLANVATAAPTAESDGYTPSNYECTIDKAMPFSIIAFPLPSPEGEGVLSVVASIIDNLVVVIDDKKNTTTTSTADNNDAHNNTTATFSNKASSFRREKRANNDTNTPLPPSTITCTPHEVCIATYASTIFCYDSMLAKFHDALNTTGDVVSGRYVLADGQVGNEYTGPRPREVVLSGPVAKALGVTGAGMLDGEGGGSGEDEESGVNPADRTGSARARRAAMGVAVGVAAAATVLGGFL